MKITKIERHVSKEHTWDITTPSCTFLLPNGCVSHNSSQILNSTNGIEMPMALISTKESKSGLFYQVVPEYNKLKNKYQLLWEQTDCIGYIKTAAVLAAYIDQSISTNTFYNPSFFRNDDPTLDRKVPTTLVINNLILGHHYGLKTFYYSLISKLGTKEVANTNEEVCDSCTL